MQVVWDEERETFTCHFFLATGRTAHCSFQTAQSVREQLGQQERNFEDVPSSSPLFFETEKILSSSMEASFEGEGSPDSGDSCVVEKMECGTEEDAMEGLSINDAVNPEVIALILQETTRHSVVMWVVCRLVCRLWKEILPQSGRNLLRKKYPERKVDESKRHSDFCVEAAARGWLSLLSWGHSKKGWEDDHLQMVCFVAAEKGRQEVLEWVSTTWEYPPKSAIGAAANRQYSLAAMAEGSRRRLG